MTINTSTAYSGPYTANGSQKVFAFAFLAMSTSELTVEVDGVVSNPATYAVALTGAAPSGGNVTFTAAPANGAKVIIYSNPSLLQQVDLTSGGSFYAETVEEGFDRAAARAIAIRRDLSRSIMVPVGESGGTVPDATTRAGKVLGFDGSGNLTVLAAGQNGAAATVAVGTVTTLSPGSPATVTNVGTSAAAVFNFGIPQGAAGSGSSVSWGGVTGTLSNQTDLQTALNGKQASHANLTAFAGVSIAADTLIYGNGAGTLGTATITAAARSILDDASISAIKTTLGLSTVASSGLASDLTGNLAGSAGSVTNALTLSNAGSGAASGTTYNGSAARTISWNSIGAQPVSPRVQSVTSSATVTPTASDDIVAITAQAVALALANPSGTPVQGQGIVIRIKDNGTGRAISYGTQYRAIGVTLPTTTTANKTTYLGMVWNATDSKWDVLSVRTEA